MADLQKELHYTDMVVTITIRSRSGKGHSLLTDKRRTFYEVLQMTADDLRARLDHLVPITPSPRTPK